MNDTTHCQESTRPAAPADLRPARAESPPAKSRRKAFWTKQFYLWHWVSSAICLVSMLLFAVTGITLNHAGSITAKPLVEERSAVLPETLRESIAPAPDEPADARKPLPQPLRLWIDEHFGISPGGRSYEWSEFDIYIDLPRPGGDGWMSIDRESGEVIHETTSRGVIAYLNDLHKGRNTGSEWVLFMDVFSFAAIIFCLTGLALLWVHARRRPSTWPIVAAGFLIPLIILIVFVHS